MEHLLFYLLAYLIVEYYTTKFSFKAPNYQFTNTKKSALNGFTVIALVILLTVLYVFVLGELIREIPNIGRFIIQISYDLLIIAVVIAAIVYKKESLQSIGIMKHDLIKSCILGTLLGALFLIICYIVAPDRYSFDIISVHSLMSFIEFCFVGLAEEISFRGYLQPRLIAWKGIKNGLLITAVLFSFLHLPVNIVFKNMGLESAFFSCVILIPLSLLIGYIMLKTKNIAAVAILHTLLDWVMNT